MGSSYLEIVELEDGSFALQKIDSEDEPLVIINFSEDVVGFLKDNQAAVVKAMIGAGVQVAGAVSKNMAEAEAHERGDRTLH